MVVGAGQAGLAAGYFLQQAAVRFQLFDRACRVGDSWRHRYDSLVLFSPRSHCALPGLAMDGEPDRYPGKDETGDYLERYAKTYGLPIALDEGIARLEQRGNHFVGLTTRGRRVISRAVVVATGAFQQSVVPPLSASLAASVTQLRGDAYRNPRQLPDGRVLVVGGGASGRQIAFELARSHRVSLSVGGAVTITPQRVFGRDVIVWFDRLGFLRADKASAKGRFARTHQSFPGLHLRDSALRDRGVHIRPRTVGATSERWTFADGTHDAFDAVVWAAGYNDNADWVRVPGAVDTNGNYIEERGVSPIPGLYYVGRSWQTSRASALLCGVGTDAARIVARVTARLCERTMCTRTPVRDACRAPECRSACVPPHRGVTSAASRRAGMRANGERRRSRLRT